MKKIFAYLKYYKKPAWIAILLMADELTVELIQPIIMSIIIDDGIKNADMLKIWSWAAVLLGMTLVAFIAGISSSFYASHVSQAVGRDLRKDLYTNIQTFSETEVQTFSTSTLITRLTNDVTQIQALIFAGLRIMLRAPLFIIGGIAMSFTINVRFALIFTAAIPLLFIILLWIMKHGVVLFQFVQKNLDKVNSIIQENLLGIRLVKAFHRENHESNRFIGINSSLLDVNKRALRLMELTMPIVMLVMNLCIVMIIWISSREIQMENVQAGELVAIINYGTRMIASFGVFSFLLMNFTRGRASANRVSEVLDQSGTEQLKIKEETKPFFNGDICFNKVSFIYPSANHPALDEISFQVHSGETVGIIGETGSGKSTLVQLIPALYKPTAGELVINDQNINDMDVHYLRSQVGIVTQEVHLFSGTIKDNIAWGHEHATDKEIYQAAKDACMHDFIMQLPNQYETVVGQRGVNLSGGQKQRLSIARVFIRKPKILLLDDSTSALDANTERKVLQTIKEMKCTTLIISQKISSVLEANNILLFHQGKILAQGNHHTLLQSNQMYRRIYQSQTKNGVMSDDESFE